jgi:aryl-alcohol dehydrogenase-like predicted oxidoreductase
VKLALGTVQFGVSYGISNKSGVPSFGEVERIIQHARSSGISLLDTAAAYGTSEAILGEVGVKSFQVTTKLRPLPSDYVSAREWVHTQVSESLKRLQVESIYSVLLHQPDQLLTTAGREIFEALNELKKLGIIHRIGISIYNPSQLESIVSIFPLDLVQTPLNIFDRRIADSGWLSRLSNQGVEIHARSIFLQGLLIMAPEEIPIRVRKWAPILGEWHAWLRKQQLCAKALCLGFARSFPEVHKIIVGVQSLCQLNELVNLMDLPIPDKVPRIDVTDHDIINPSLWPKM